jgi:hypothetical protein
MPTLTRRKTSKTFEIRDENRMNYTGNFREIYHSNITSSEVRPRVSTASENEEEAWLMRRVYQSWKEEQCQATEQIDGNTGNKEGAILINEDKCTTCGCTVSGNAAGEDGDEVNANKITRNINELSISCVISATTAPGKGVYVVTGVSFTKDDSETIDESDLQQPASKNIGQ